VLDCVVAFISFMALSRSVKGICSVSLENGLHGIFSHPNFVLKAFPSPEICCTHIHFGVLLHPKELCRPFPSEMLDMP
jgi:hypothetical protein